MLRQSFRGSLYCRTLEVDGEPAAIGGLAGDILSDQGSLWLMTTSTIERVPVSFLRELRRELAAALAYKPRLEGCVAAGYTAAIRLLEALGFALDTPVPTRPKQALFRRFHIDADESAAFAQQKKVIRAGAHFAPFIVYTAGRSRSAWLAAFLSYGRCRCHHEIAITLRGMQDLVSLLARPGTGIAETAAAPGWRLVEHHVPGARSVVVRRPLEDVVASFLADYAGVAPIDEGRLRSIIAYENRCLEQISARPGTLTVDFKDMERMEVCSAVFEHCLPYCFDEGWWRAMRGKNIQANVADIFRYYQQNAAGVAQLKRSTRREMIALARAGKLRRGSEA